MTEPASSLEARLAFAKSIGLILCAVALIWAAPASLLFEPAAPDQRASANRALRSLWFAVLHYQVDYGTFPPACAPDGGLPASLTTPIAYVASVCRDPYSTAVPAALPAQEASNRAASRRVTFALCALFAARLALMALGPARGRTAGWRAVAELLAGGLVLAAWAAAARALQPPALRMSALGALTLGALGLFGLRLLTQGALLLLALCACGAVFALMTARGILLWAAAGAFAMAVLRTALFYWTLHVMKAKRLPGPWELRVPGWRFLFPSCLWLTAASSMALLALAGSQLSQTQAIRALEYGAAPIACAMRPDFFALSSNGPDFQPDWRAVVLFQILDEKGPESAGQYLTQNLYDPTNGVVSRGDILLFETLPQAERKSQDAQP